MKCADRLRGMNEKVVDADLLYVLYKGCPKEYSSTIATLRAMGVDTLDRAVRALKDQHEALQLEKKQPQAEASSASQTVYQVSGHQSKRGRGHWRGSGRSRGGGHQIRCFNCGAVGHMAKMCPKGAKVRWLWNNGSHLA